MTLTGAHVERTAAARVALPDDMDVVRADARQPSDAERLAHHLGEPDEVAQLALFLASGASSYVTGTEINIDGGLAISA